MSKVADTVSWVMKDEKILKLKKADETYDLDDSLFASLDKSGVLDSLDDKDVEVKIDGTKITDLQVVGVKAEEADIKKVEEKPEEKKEASVDKDRIVKELTVNGVSVDKRGVIFKEEEKVWYTLADDLNVQEFKDKYTGQVVEIYVEETEQGNDIITGFAVKDSADKEKSASKNTYSNGANATQLSIEAQASVNSANRVVQALVSKNDTVMLPEDVEKVIKRISEYNFQMIQDLKNKG